MTADEAARILQTIISEEIAVRGVAPYSTVRDRFAEEAGEEWIVPGKSDRRNISPKVNAARNRLDDPPTVMWSARRRGAWRPIAD